MIWRATVRQLLLSMGTAFPNSWLQATPYALQGGAMTHLQARRCGHVLQEVSLCKPKLLERSAALFLTTCGGEHQGALFLEGDVRALWLLRATSATESVPLSAPSISAKGR